MRQLWTILIILFVWNNQMLSQRNVALLNMPVRALEEEILTIDKLVSLPFRLDRGMIYLEAEIEGHTGDFILDTGAPGLVINEIPQKSSDEYLAQSCSDQVMVGVKSVKTFLWAKRTIHDLEAITLDLSHLENAHKGEVTGMIGYELLKNHILFLDYQRSQLLLLQNKMHVAAAAPTARIPFQLYDHLPVIEVDLGKEKLRLGIDTGAATNLLDRKRSTQLTEFLMEQPTEELQGLDQSIQKVGAAFLEGFAVGEFKFSEKFLLLDLSHLEVDAEQPLDGLLGYQFLANYKVAIDYPNQEILLWPLD